jgi:CubicO group peptidase (beta-lactamase class C family)
VTGKPPFEGSDALAVAVKHLQEEPAAPSTLNPSIPADWDAVVLKALQNEPARRFQSAKELRAVLTTLSDEPGKVAARPARWHIVTVLACVLLVVLAVVVVLWAHRSTTSGASALSGQIDAYLSGLAAHQRLSGTVLVAQRGTIILEKGYGLANREKDVPNTANTPYVVGGISASFSGVGALWLEEHGKLADQASICTYLSHCPAAWRPITVHMVLDNSADLPQITWGVQGNTPTQTLQALQTEPLTGTPGSNADNSNGDTLVLARIIQKVSGESWTSFVQRTIFGPAGMTHSGRMTDALARSRQTQSYSGNTRNSDTVYNDYFAAYSTARAKRQPTVDSRGAAGSARTRSAHRRPAPRPVTSRALRGSREPPRPREPLGTMPGNRTSPCPLYAGGMVTE